MTLIIPNALPALTSAQALIEPFASRYPRLVHLFNAKKAQPESWLQSEHGCTPTEGLRLASLGYQPAPGTPIGAGLGPLQADVTDKDQVVWVAELCATLVSQERTTALPLSLIEASPDEITALEASAHPLFSANNDALDIEPLGGGLWRVRVDLPATAKTISPLALMGQDLGDWWPTGHEWRSWRKRINEIQMTWHDHPINLAREQRGLPAINNVWLYGGGKGFTPRQTAQEQWLDTLSLAAWRGDWAGWLDAWQGIETTLLAAEPEREIILTADDRIIRLNNAPKRWWQNLFASRQQDAWRHWWLNHN